MLHRVVTWNLLHPSYALANRYPWARGKDLLWERRKWLIVDELSSLEPDVVCCQEVLYGEAPPIPGFNWEYAVTKQRRRQIDRGGHPLLCAIGYHTKRYNLVQSLPTSRTLTVTLRDIESAEELSVSSVHLPVQNESESIVHLSKPLGDIVVGDFNDFPDSKCVLYLEDHRGYNNVYHKKQPRATYNKSVLDYMFASDRWAFKRVCWAKPQGKIPSARWPSDHLWVMATFHSSR